MAATAKEAVALSKKPVKKKIQRILKHREAKLVENTKTAYFMKGSKTSNTVTSLLHDLSILKKPDCVLLSKRNPIHPFDNIQSMEFFSKKNDASLFAYVSNTKKRPDNLVLGRFYDHHMLDLVEFGVTNYKAIADFPKALKPVVGSKPSFIFAGAEFETFSDHKKIANVFLDFFRGTVTDSINLAGLDHVIVLQAVGDSISFKHYSVVLKKSGTKLPKVELVECGPSFDLTMRRSSWASDDLMKETLKAPKALVAKKIKNIKTNEFKQTLGKVHFNKQDISSMATRKFKAFKKGKKREREPERENANKKSKT